MLCSLLLLLPSALPQSLSFGSYSDRPCLWLLCDRDLPPCTGKMWSDKSVCVCNSCIVMCASQC
jgi:hypothetical protein